MRRFVYEMQALNLPIYMPHYHSLSPAGDIFVFYLKQTSLSKHNEHVKNLSNDVCMSLTDLRLKKHCGKRRNGL